MALIRPSSPTLTRRTLLRRGALAGGGLAAGSLLPARAFAQASAPAVITSERARPALPSGVQAGDLLGDRAILWAQADRPARMLVEWATTESFADARRLPGPAALEDGDFTAKLDLAGLPAGQRIFYRVTMVDLADQKLVSEPAAGSFRTPLRRAPEPPLRLVGRCRRPGLGHQPRLGRHEDLRGDARGRARLLHPFGRHDLRRRAVRGRAGTARRRHLAEPDDRSRPRRSRRRSPSSAATTPTT